MKTITGITFFSIVAFSISASHAIEFDFSVDGVGPNFTEFQQRPFWTIATDSTGLRISKPADDGSTFAVPDTRSDAGVIAKFSFGGNFEAILDFSWNETATPSFSAGDNSASFILASTVDPNYSIVLSSVSLWNGTQRVDVNYSNPVLALLPPAATDPNTSLSGALQFTRSGSSLDLSWGSTHLDTITLPVQMQGEMFVTIDAHQGQGWLHPTFTGIDPRDPMDVSFAKLVIEADEIIGVVPEPTTCTLALAALCLAIGRRRSR